MERQGNIGILSDRVGQLCLSDLVKKSQGVEMYGYRTLWKRCPRVTHSDGGVRRVIRVLPISCINLETRLLGSYRTDRKEVMRDMSH